MTDELTDAQLDAFERNCAGVEGWAYDVIRVLVAALRSERTQREAEERMADWWADECDRIRAELERERTQNLRPKEALEMLIEACLLWSGDEVSLLPRRVARAIAAARAALSTQEEDA